MSLLITAALHAPKSVHRFKEPAHQVAQQVCFPNTQYAVITCLFSFACFVLCWPRKGSRGVSGEASSHVVEAGVY